MEASPGAEVTVLLARARAGDGAALDAAYSAVYDELKRAARLQLRRMRDDFHDHRAGADDGLPSSVGRQRAA